MAEEVAAQETTVQPSDHVSISDTGVLTLSNEALEIMESKPEVVEPEKKEAEPEASPKEPEKPKRKIKWQGQEVELEPDKEEELLQKGFDYTQKTQALAEERNKLTPYIGLINAMESDHEKALAIAKILKGETIKEQQFDDPIEQLKYETRQEVLKEVEEKFIKPLQQKTETTSREQVIESVRNNVQKDPLFTEVDKAMRDYISELPESIARPFYNQVNNDPKSYLEFFNKLRTKIAANKKEPEKKEELPEPVKRETHAPILESGGKTTSDSSSKALHEKIKELTKRSRQGDYQATGELLELNALK